MTEKGILLDSEFDLIVSPVRDANGLIISGFVLGDNLDQNAVMVLKLRQGDLKEDPLLGAGLTKFMRGKYDASAIESRIKQHFIRAGIDYDRYKDRIILNVK